MYWCVMASATPTIRPPTTAPRGLSKPPSAAAAIDERDEELARIFEPGARGALGLESPGDGSGLGLALGRRLARAAGGDLVAHADPAGGRFELTLPPA